MAECSRDTSNANKPHAPKNYRKVPVLSLKTENGTIKIQTFKTDGSKAFIAIPWRNRDIVWPFCPSTLLLDGRHHTSTPVRPDLTSGVVYLDETFINDSKILGGGTKWPNALDDEVEDLFTHVAPITVSQLLLNANERVDSGEPAAPRDVDLMQRTLAPTQTLAILDGPMEVELTREGCKAIDAAEGDSATRVVPVTVRGLLLKGTEALPNDGVESAPGEVNLMLRKDAPPQRLKITEGLMKVKLTRDGCAIFNIPFPDAQHLPDAFMVIKLSDDENQIAIARSIVAACESLLDAKEKDGEEASKKWQGPVRIEDAKKLVAEVSPR